MIPKREPPIALRVRWSALVLDQGGLLHYPRGAPGAPSGESHDLGAPFSGLAYRMDEGVLQSIAVVEGGVVTGVSTDWIEIPPGGRRVDAALLEASEDYGPLRFEGVPLTGAAYDFEATGACVQEAAYLDGRATEVSQRAWYPSGALRELVGGGEATSWFEDGRLQRRAAHGVLSFNLIVPDGGRLRGIFVADANLFDLETVRRLPFADEVLLMGEAFDESFLRALAVHTGLAAVPRLRLIDTGATPAVVDVLVSLPRLAELWLVKNRSLGTEDAEHLRRRRPDCVVHFEAIEEALSRS